MNKKAILAAPQLRGVLLGAGVLACVAAMSYGFVQLQSGSSADQANLAAADAMRLTAREIVASAWQSSRGEESTFNGLAAQVDRFEQQMSGMDSTGLVEELSVVDVAWQPVKRAAQTLVEAGPKLVFVNAAAQKLSRDLRPMQGELAAVADSLAGGAGNSTTVAAAQKNLWLSERLARNVNRILAGGSDSAEAADEFRTDSSELLRNIEALTRGDTLVGIGKVTDAAAIDAMSSAFRKFSTISTSVDRIAGSAKELRDAALAREDILASSEALGESLASLDAAIVRLSSDGLDQRGLLTALFVGPALLAIGLVLLQYVGQRRRAAYLGQGVAEINHALGKVGEGDLTVEVAESNKVTADLARKLNSSTRRQRQLIWNIRRPFESSVDEVNRIGITARSLVEKGKELTRSVGDSIAAVTEMVKTSEEIKTSTADAARTSDRNCEQVAQGYELTKDMSKASVDVRESVQETSKSAKRQGELIQSVTAAAEYIQALNTKISVVAINTRIEAEKAGEYGRPFLGIAESIADLLREAGDEGRKIISEVRTLQNMSAENLASMENTVGTVVTILEYIERLDSSLEEINSGSAAISSIIRTVDEAAGQSAVNALNMNTLMSQIRERNLEIGKFSETTQRGVARLQKSMRDASDSLGQFKADSGPETAAAPSSEPDDLETIGVASRVYREEDMSALESAERARASV